MTVKIDSFAAQALEKVLDKRTDNKIRTKQTSFSARVSRIDNDGNVWVHFPGGARETPVKYISSDVSVNDTVTATISNGYVRVNGNITAPAASVKTVRYIAAETTDYINKSVDAVKKLAVEELVALKGYFKQLDAEQADIRSLVSETISTDKLDAAIATVENLIASQAIINILTTNEADIMSLIASSATVEDLISGNATIASLIANSGVIETLISNSISVGDLLADRATIETLAANNISVTDLIASSAVLGTLIANNATIANLFGTNAEIQNLISNHISVSSLNADKLDASFGNFDTLTADITKIKEVLSATGWFEAVNIEEGRITGKLTAVQIDGDVLNVKNLKADSIIMLGDDGLYYALNVNGLGQAYVQALDKETQDELRNGLHGENIITGTITADKIYVSDLAAFHATIAGIRMSGIERIVMANGIDVVYVKKDINGNFPTITSTHVNDEGKTYIYADGELIKTVNDVDGTAVTVTTRDVNIGTFHTVGKDSLNSPTPGFFFDSDGHFALGTDSDYIVLYQDESDQWKMRLNASSIQIGGSRLVTELDMQNTVESTVSDVLTENVDSFAAITLQIESSNGNIFKNRTGTTILTARIFRGSSEIDTSGNYTYSWTRYDSSGIRDNAYSANTKSITVNAFSTGSQWTYKVEVTW